VPESELVRELIFVVQAIDSAHVRYDAAADAFLPSPTLALPRAARQLLTRVAEAGTLYRRLRGALGVGAGRGPAARALSAAVEEELRDYFRLVALLESRAQAAPPRPGGADGAVYLTLRRMEVWVGEARERLRSLASLLAACQGLAGGALAAALHARCALADPQARGLAERLLGSACEPLLDALAAWLTRGELGEGEAAADFFVQADEAAPPEALWRRRYSLRAGARPPFLSEEQAEEALRIGKGLNFLRTLCADAGWAADAGCALAAAAAAGGLQAANAPAIAALLAEAGGRCDARVRAALFGRFQLGVHCAAIKRYLLLGQGDFIAALMDAVGPELGGRAAAVSAYQLTGVLETAIRASNAQFDDPDTLGRLRVRLMPHGSGESGWDVFSLEYVVGPPLSTLLTEEALASYLRVFNFLWRLKRVEHALNGAWDGMKGSSAAAGGGGGGGSGGGGRPASPAGRRAAAPLAQALRRCHLLRAEMAHFVANLQYYIMFEVLEESWAAFTAEMAGAANLDGLIEAHERYLEAIVSKALLGERSALLAQQLNALFDVMLRFRALAQRLAAAAAEAGAAAGLAALAARAGAPPPPPPPQPLSLSPAEAGAQLESVAADFSALLEGFLNLLPVQRHVDLVRSVSR